MLTIWISAHQHTSVVLEALAVPAWLCSDLDSASRRHPEEVQPVTCVRPRRSIFGMPFSTKACGHRCYVTNTAHAEAAHEPSYLPPLFVRSRDHLGSRTHCQGGSCTQQIRNPMLCTHVCQLGEAWAQRVEDCCLWPREAILPSSRDIPSTCSWFPSNIHGLVCI